MTNHNISRRTVAVEHVRITSSVPFAIVKENIERILPPLPDSLLQMMGSGDKEGVREIEEKGPKLYIFAKRDHGRTLTVAVGPRNAIQYVVGNPTTAVKMTRHDIRASLYAPLQIHSSNRTKVTRCSSMICRRLFSDSSAIPKLPRWACTLTANWSRPCF